jgi:hypothetical protein
MGSYTQFYLKMSQNGKLNPNLTSITSVLTMQALADPSIARLLRFIRTPSSPGEDDAQGAEKSAKFFCRG